ncbi:MAG: NAD(P)/FAD-dependent oxidoreductase [Clostridia bacterium]|nr:NAD(P)/FAD-dependent oxidoreductase [Clostridia bacterium]
MKIVVIGGGAGGMMAAGAAAQVGADVTLLERNEKTGKKLYLTGKGRCNLTNVDESFLDKVVVNPKFLFGALKCFSAKDTMQFFKDCGLDLKVERGGRVFPQSDKSSDVINALNRYLNDSGVNVRLNSYVSDTIYENGQFVVSVNGEKLRCDKLIIATGGKSYSKTGSTGNGYIFAHRFGHTIVPPVTSLTGINTVEKTGIEGLTLKNVEVCVKVNDKTVKSCFGELLFTHEGVSGPTVLTLSAYINRLNLKGAELSIDFKPALSAEELDKRILIDFSSQQNKDFCNALDMLLPKSVIPSVVRQSGISEHTKINSISAAQRKRLVDTLKDYRLHIEGLCDIDTAVITSGGVSVKEVNPSTMQSKIVNGLYFAGEVLDVDALTGGYNLQIAWSTGRLAGISAAKGR